jgi:hypothetical protein
LQPGTAYDLWITRFVGDLPGTAASTRVTTNFAPPTIEDVWADAAGLHVRVTGRPAEAALFPEWEPAAYDADGTYRYRADAYGLRADPPASARTLAAGSSSWDEVLIPYVTPGTGYEIYVRYGDTNPRHGHRTSAYSYWNSTTGASQSTYAPVPAAPSVVARS